MNTDPRKDGFNYGIGWGKEPKPPIYLEAMALCRRLNDQLMQLSREAWQLEMSIRAVRLAETGVEKAAAVNSCRVFDLI